MGKFARVAGPLNDRLSYEITVNDYGRVIESSDATASYTISDISMDFEVVESPELGKPWRLSTGAFFKFCMIELSIIVSIPETKVIPIGISNLRHNHSRRKAFCWYSLTQTMAAQILTAIQKSFTIPKSQRFPLQLTDYRIRYIQAEWSRIINSVKSPNTFQMESIGIWVI